MTTLQTYLTQVQRLVHDLTNASYSQSELTDYINEAREDVALDMHCVRTLVTGVQLMTGVEIYPVNGAIVGATVTAGGTYTTAPAVSFGTPPAGATTPIATAVLTATAVTSLAFTQWGSGYTPGTPPTISFTPAGAAATPIQMDAFQVVSISNIWNTQRYTLKFTGFTLFQAYWRQWTTNFLSRPAVWTIHPQMLQVYLRAMPDQLYLSEWDVLTLPRPLVSATDIDTQVTVPWNKAVQFRAAAIALMKHQNFEQAEYYDRKYEQRVPRFIMGAGGIRIPNPYNRSFQRKIGRT